MNLIILTDETQVGQLTNTPIAGVLVTMQADPDSVGLSMNSILESEDPFHDSDEWIAAQVRQLFRAHNAEDAKAYEVCLFYFKDHLVKTLARHLKGDVRWDSHAQWLDGLGGTSPVVYPPSYLLLRDEIVWATMPGQEHWYVEPFEFEITLSPLTGVLADYTIRFGDDRPLIEKALSTPSMRTGHIMQPGRKGWVFVFRRTGGSLSTDKEV